MGMVWEGWLQTATSLLAAAQCKALDYSWVLGGVLLGSLALKQANESMAATNVNSGQGKQKDAGLSASISSFSTAKSPAINVIASY